MIWGDRHFGGDCAAVQDRPKNVQKIQATSDAFAAILADGSVIAWGNPKFGGGDCSAVQDQLRNVQQIQSTVHAFAAILADGSVVAWGDADSGGICSAVQDQLRNVQQIQAADEAFAAILADGSVVAWGNPYWGGDCSAVQDEFLYFGRFVIWSLHHGKRPVELHEKLAPSRVSPCQPRCWDQKVPSGAVLPLWPFESCLPTEVKSLYPKHRQQKIIFFLKTRVTVTKP